MSAIATIMHLNAYSFSLSAAARSVAHAARSSPMLAKTSAAAIEPMNEPVLKDDLIEEDAAFDESSLGFKVSFRSMPPENDVGLSCWLHPDGERWVCVEDFSLWEHNSDSLDDSY